MRGANATLAARVSDDVRTTVDASNIVTSCLVVSAVIATPDDPDPPPPRLCSNTPPALEIMPGAKSLNLRDVMLPVMFCSASA